MKQNGRSAEESNIKKDIYGCEVEDNKIKRKKKQEKYAESPDAAYGGEDETHTNDTLLNHDNVNGSNCKKKKRKLKQKVTERTEDEQTDQGKTGKSYFDKLDQEVKEHLLKEEETMKQNGRSAEESNIKNDIYGCEVEDNKIKRKKKQQEKYAESVDAAYGGEDETHTNDTLLNHDNVNSSNCKKKKRKLKQEVTERTEDEQRDQGKTGKSDFDSSLTICNRSKKKCAKNLLQENDESVYYQDIIPAGDLTTEKKYSSKELKKAKKSVHRDSEKVDHCEMEHNEIVEEEARKQKMKKRKYDKDGSTHNIQEQTLVQYNVEETDAESHNRKNCEEPSENVEDSNEARNNTKFKQDVCNSNIKNTAGANIRISDFEKIDVRLRKMKPSAFAQFVDPSLIRFRGSNLFSIPGYGCY
ncbi:hypothetical protein L798_00946 [Zootermopsis nevadensis]|nr:hypothetical protein L798_00946 [Zootermopsis nevadensis]